jgi:hypothetical protein
MLGERTDERISTGITGRDDILGIGPPLTQFRGIFMGTPNYFSESIPLMAELGDGTSS